MCRPTAPSLAPVLILLLLIAGCPGDDDDATPPEPGYASAWVLESLDHPVPGPLAGAVRGDVVMENARVRVVLQQPGRAIALNPYGGTLIDADVVRGDGVHHDRWGEVAIWLNSHVTMAPETMEIVDDGSDGAAVVRFEGPGRQGEPQAASPQLARLFSRRVDNPPPAFPAVTEPILETLSATTRPVFA